MSPSHQRRPDMVAGRRHDLIRALGRDGWNARPVDRETVLASKEGTSRLIRVAIDTSPPSRGPALGVFTGTAHRIGAIPEIGWWPPSAGDPQFLKQRDWVR